MTLSPPVPPKFTAGQFPQPLDFNTDIRDAFNFLTRKTVFRAWQNTVQSIPNNAITVIKLDTVAEDTYSGWNSGTWTYTLPVAGRWAVTGGYQSSGGSAAANTAASFVIIDGNQYPAAEYSISQAGWTVPVYYEFYGLAGVQVQLGARQVTGAALNTAAGSISASSSMEILWIST